MSQKPGGLPIKFKGASDLPNVVVSLGSMEWNQTGSWRYMRPQYENRVPACSNGCPAGNDIEGFVRLIGEKRYTEAWLLLKEENPLTRVCGRVCFHPCEPSCNRRQYDLPVSINALERFAGEHADRSLLTQAVRKPTGKTVAIVGSGPAGLTAAFYLAKIGHKVTVYEAMALVGGVLRYGIPEHRLPREVLDDEIDDIKAMGVDFVCDTRVGQDGDATVSYATLEGFDAVLVAVGAHKSRKLGIPGEEGQGVISGLELLRRVQSGERLELGGRIAVIGGGNTALDAARTATRLQTRVDLYYRRSRAEMPAFEEEVEEAVREGVGMHVLVAPVRIERGDDGRVLGVVLRRMQLGDPDASGRREAVPVDGSDYLVEADTVVAAIGEVVDPQALPESLVKERDGSLSVDDMQATSDKGMWAGGDVTPSLRMVVTAIGAGKRAAVAIDKYLGGATKEDAQRVMRVGKGGAVSMSRYLATGGAHAKYDDHHHVVHFDELNPAYFTHEERGRLGRLPVSERLRGKALAEVNLGLTEEQALIEAARCFHCGVCTECDNCYVFCPDVAIKRREGAPGYEIDYDFCKGCGICVAECPRSSMTMQIDEGER